MNLLAGRDRSTRKAVALTRHSSVSAGVLAALLVAVSACAAASEPFTVAAEIELAHFGDPYGLEADEVRFSPNGAYVAAYAERGRLELNRPEGELRIYQTADIRRSLRDSHVSASVTPLWSIVRSADLDGPVITHWRWLADSSGVAFLERHEHGSHQLILAELMEKETKVLTPADEDVRAFDIRDATHYAYARADAGLQRQAVDQRKSVAIVGTGRSFADLLFPIDQYPSMASRADRTELWAVVGGRRFGVRDKASGKPSALFQTGELQFALSPDGQTLITELPVPEVPKVWEALYPPIYAESPDRVRAGPQELTAFSGSSLIDQYVRIDLEDGTVVPLTDAPTGSAAGWPYGGVPTWSNDGRAVILPGSFIVNAQGLPGRPCLTMVRFEPASVICVEQIKGATSTAYEPSVWVTDIRFDGPGSRRFYTDYLNLDGTGTRGRSLYTQEPTGHWRETKRGSGMEVTAHSGVQVVVKQDLNYPPQLVATDARSKITRGVWDPNPQLKEIALGAATVLRWKDSNGRDRRAGLFRPVPYIEGRRYPLVIQTHGFGVHDFRPSGVFPTAFAARALAGAGIAVVQDEGCESPTTRDEGPCNVRGYESVVKQLVAQGLVDPERVGIIGFSRTCFYVMQALTTSAIRFKAASITDGVNEGYLQYMLDVDALGGDVAREADVMMGAAPFRSGLQQWLKQSPEFNLDKVTAPLQVVALSPFSLYEMWEPYAGLRYLAKPVDADEVVAAFGRDAGDPHAAVPGQPLSVDRLEWEHIQRVLAENNGNVSATARALNMHRRTLQRKLSKHPVRS
jgi:hypothetical protein